VQSTKQWTETKAERKARKAREKTGLSSDKKYVVCLKWGQKYSAEYVNKLYDMVDRNITIDYEFVCFTEDTNGINKNIEVKPLPNIPATGWWYKPYFVGADVPLKGTMLFLDLDVIVFKNIDKLFEYNNDKFCIIRDFNRHLRPTWDRMNSSVFKTPVGLNDTHWQNFKKGAMNEMKKNRGDQDWMFKHIRGHKFWPDEWIMSYKWEMRDRRDLQLNTTTRKRNFVVDAPPKIHNDTCIAVFHGEPNPADANDSWVKQHWG